jgi:hypothetical protein
MYEKLTNTIVQRAGETASSWTMVGEYFSSKTIFHVAGPNDIHYEGKATLSVIVKIPAAGGGVTEVAVNIGQDDFPRILRSIAKNVPDTADLFSECLTVAIKSQLEAEANDDD